MAAPQNKIGDHEFVELNGNVGLVTSQPEVLTRPGVNGVAIWDTGVRGEPFQLQTGVDLGSWNDVHAKLLEYRELIDEDPVEITQCGKPLTAQTQHKWQVLTVDLADERQLGQSVGGLNAPSAAWIACVWTLVPIKQQQTT